MDGLGSPSQDFFSHDYATARARFRAAAHDAGGRLESLDIAAKGPSGENLSIDFAWFGPTSAQQVLIHTSGLHGVEGFAGSAIQLQWLATRPPSPPAGCAVVIAHILNPYGMAWLRRFNENNLDLNRNFFAPGEPYAGAPPGYAQLDTLLSPASPPSNDFFYLRAAFLVARHGLQQLKQTVASGQYVNPKGLVFGGSRLEEGPRRLKEYLNARLNNVQRVTVIDVHTGLGRFADDRMLTETQPAPVFAEVQRAYGAAVQPLGADGGGAFQVCGGHHFLYRRIFGENNVYYAAQEFGTRHAIAVLAALRDENHWHHYGAAQPDHPSKRRLLDAFHPQDPRWQQTLLLRGAEVINHGLALAFGA